MDKREISWSKTAKLDIKNILHYYIERNKSKEYSIRLFKEIKHKLQTIDVTIALPQKTVVNDLFYFIHNYIAVFFVIKNNTITVKFVIDDRRNPKMIQSLVK